MIGTLMNGLLWVVKEVKEAADQEVDNEERDLKLQLSALNLQLDERQISEDEFAARETQILDRMDELSGVDPDDDGFVDQDDEDEEEDEDEDEEDDEEEEEEDDDEDEDEDEAPAP